jgi:hypothetical protein
MISLGVAPILKRGDIFYTNWFGGLVFSPLAIIFGFLPLGAPRSSRVGFLPHAKRVENDSWRKITPTTAPVGEPRACRGSKIVC